MSVKRRDILKYRKISLICLYTSIPLNIIRAYIRFRPIQNIISPVGVGLLVSFFVINLIFWRCPRCKKRLPMRLDWKNNFDEVICPYCDMNFLYADDDASKD